MKRFFNTILWFILLLIVLAILGIIFLPQTAVQFFGEEQKNNIRATLGCEAAIIQETAIDFDEERETINNKLDILINKQETEQTGEEENTQPEENNSEDNGDIDSEEEEAETAPEDSTNTEPDTNSGARTE